MLVMYLDGHDLARLLMSHLDHVTTRAVTELAHVLQFADVRLHPLRAQQQQDDNLFHARSRSLLAVLDNWTR